ncbi:MAG: chorismate-binding protein, partial [Propionibacteriaceae bacterium]|nr:chorismate-binding protein [Propionibacteriaceae bacterium]
MDITPSLAAATALAEGYRRVPVWATFPAQTLTPADAFLRLKRLSKQCFILESRENEQDSGRYTFLGFDPTLELTCQDGHLTITSAARFEQDGADPAAAIRQILADNSAPRVTGLPPFTGGLVGYFAYDFVRYAEPTIDLGQTDIEGFRDVDLMLFDKVVAFDRLEQTVTIIVNILTDNLPENYARAEAAVASLMAILHSGQMAAPAPLELASEWRALFGPEEYAAMVLRAKGHIKDGDIFQVVLSNRLECDATGSLFETYQLMSAANPSPYMFYFSSDDVEIAGAAPETLVKLRDGELETFPLAGTRPRGVTPDADLALEQELLADPKELAEHNMLVDLGRNDIGRIA